MARGRSRRTGGTAHTTRYHAPPPGASVRRVYPLSRIRPALPDTGTRRENVVQVVVDPGDELPDGAGERRGPRMAPEGITVPHVGSLPVADHRGIDVHHAMRAVERGAGI